MSQHRLHLTAIVTLLLLTCGLWSRPGRNLSAVDAVSAATKPGQSVVGIVRSDFEKLKQPTAPDAELSEAQIEELTRWATAMGGGLQSVIDPRAEWIAIKVNIVELKKPGSGVVTDVRVVKAVVKLAHEAAPGARISIVEGSGEWIAPDVPGADTTGAQVEDGWAEAGYRALLTDPDLEGIRLDLVDLNIDEAVLTTVPDKWHAREQFWVPRTVRDCDALINVPVMKITQDVGMTVAMKNFIGIAPGLKYGWPKMRGRPGVGPGIPHTPQILDETIVDLTALANPVFTVVDAIVAMEKDKTDRRGGVPVRMNTVIAGSDIVAIDASCARLMGLNPDDLEYITLAAYEGMGRMNEDQITVNGQPIAQIARRFVRSPAGDGSWGEMGHYGQGNRTWLLRLATGEALDLQAKPRPGQEGWSEPVYFSDDRIDLAKFFGGFKEGKVAGFAEFYLPQATEAVLWLGSDEDLAVWIDGQEVYRFAGARRHRLPNDRVPLPLAAGDHRLFVEVGQTGGRCEFNLNICEDEKDPRYEGNRVKGLKFGVPAQGKGMRSVQADEFLKPSAAAVVLDQAHWAMNPSTLVGALQGALKARGDSTLSRAQLMGLTGYAFRLTVSDTLGWADDPGGDGIESDPEVALRSGRALGYDLRLIRGNDRQPGARDSLRAIWASAQRDLERGVPIILHQWGCWLIRGYDPEKELYLVSAWDEETWMPFDEIADHDTGDFGALFLGEPRPVELRQAGKASLQAALAFSRQADQGNLAHGLRAYEKWINALEQDKVTDPWAHAFHIEVLLGARQDAAAYLDTLASQSDKGAAAHLRQAAGHYRKEIESLQALNQLMGFPPAGVPDRLKDPAQRTQGAALLKEALKWEKAALAEIEQAPK